MNTCYSCQAITGERTELSVFTIYKGKYWFVSHAYPTSLKGWLVIVLNRHAEALHQLTGNEFEELKTLLQKTTKLLHRKLDTKKEYVAFFAETEHFHHVHIHIIPRHQNLPEELCGPKIFSLLKNNRADVLSKDILIAFCKELSGEFGI